MNAFKRKSLYVAVVAGLGALGASQAGAVNISTDNVGQVLLYPYYTTRSVGGNAWITSFTVVNTTSAVKVAKVRFLEGKNSAEVLDFNLWLSPKDVWAGVVTDTGAGAKITTPDNSCTTAEGAGIKTTGALFSNLFYIGLAAGAPLGADNGGLTLDRTREGYIEVIEMGQIVDLTSTVAVAVTHVPATAIPANCAVIQTFALNGTAPFTGTSTILTAAGGLTGNGIIINGATGTESGYVPTVLANWNNIAPTYTAPGDLLPNLSGVNPLNSVVFVSGTAGIATDTGWANPIDAVSALFMHSSIINEYEVTASISGKTDLVITAPTKRFYVFPFFSGSVTPVPPFANMFEDPLSLTSGLAKSCDPALVSAYDREEGPYSASVAIGVSPAPAGAGPNQINMCYESNVISVVPFGTAAVSGSNPSSVYGSINNGFIVLPASQAGIGKFDSGWVNLRPNSANAATTGLVGPANTYFGLPVIGFAAVTAMASATNAQSGLGSTFANKYTTTITTP